MLAFAHRPEFDKASYSTTRKRVAKDLSAIMSKMLQMERVLTLASHRIFRERQVLHATRTVLRFRLWERNCDMSKWSAKLGECAGSELESMAAY